MELLAALGVALGIYVAFVLVLVWLGRREEARAWAALVPHALILTKRLLRDPRVSGLDKALLWVLLAYIASPIDLVPDFIPVAGVLDDAVLVALVLRHLLRRSGQGIVAEHWPGPERSLRLVLRLAGARKTAARDRLSNPEGGEEASSVWNTPAARGRRGGVKLETAVLSAALVYEASNERLPSPARRQCPSSLGRRRAPVAALVVLAIFAHAALPAQADPPRAGKRYDGRSATGQRSFLRVAPDGSRLSQYDFVVRTRCSDGRNRIQGLNHHNEAPALIDAAGGFSYTSQFKPLTFLGRRSLRGQARLSVTGSFTAGGEIASGSIRAEFRSRRVTCDSGSVGFTVYLDGTVGAPYRNGIFATGRYGTVGDVSPAFRTFVPAGFVTSARFGWVSRCRSGATIRARERFISLTLRRGRFRSSGSYAVRFRQRGFRGTTRYEFAGRFSYRRAYVVRGYWRARTVVRRRGSVVDVCRTGRDGFSGNFDGGPSGPGDFIP